MATTVRDIAELAGVSKAAVSKVLHNSSSSVRVSEARSEQIRKIASDLGYVPNQNARILRTQRTNTIGVYFENLRGISDGPLYTVNLLDGLCSELFKRHYRVTLLAELDGEDTDGSLGDGRLDGVIWCKLGRDDKCRRAIHTCPIPLVALNVPDWNEPTNAGIVRCDNRGGLEAAVAHLWDLGHRHILFLNEVNENNATECMDRRIGFQEAMATRGIEVTKEDFAEWEWDLPEFSDWWASQPPHTAVICWSERCAGQLLSICDQQSVDVPSQLSVIGFDSTQYCESTRPRLTAIRQPISEMASRAAQMLLSIIEGEKPSIQTHTFPCTLDIRDSTSISRR